MSSSNCQIPIRSFTAEPGPATDTYVSSYAQATEPCPFPCPSLAAVHRGKCCWKDIAYSPSSAPRAAWRAMLLSSTATSLPITQHQPESSTARGTNSHGLVLLMPGSRGRAAQQGGRNAAVGTELCFILAPCPQPCSSVRVCCSSTSQQTQPISLPPDCMVSTHPAHRTPHLSQTPPQTMFLVSSWQIQAFTFSYPKSHY